MNGVTNLSAEIVRPRMIKGAGLKHVGLSSIEGGAVKRDDRVCGV